MEAETGSDRLGLRQSVRKRIERLGGSVVIWSRPGAGTSVLLTLPAGPAPAGTPASSAPTPDSTPGDPAAPDTGASTPSGTPDGAVAP